MIVRGQTIECFTIGQLAAALNRTANTLRGWEADRILPRATYVTPSKDPRGRRRLYTRAQCEGLIRLANELGIMDAAARFPLAEFKRRAWKLFTELKGAG